VVDGPRAFPASFRDPRGFVFARDGVLYRQVGQAHGPHYDHLMGSGLYGELVENNLLIPHTEVEQDLAFSEDAYCVLRPERVPFISYPYEWGYMQLRDAALVTLSVQSAAMGLGMTLRDGSAFNLTFHRGVPVFLDTTSFGILQEGQPWIAYRQFCQHFLAPLALMSYRDVRLGQLGRVHLDGIPLDLAAALLPARAKRKPGLMMHVLMHSSSQRRHEADEMPTVAKRFSRRALEGLLESLRRAIESLPDPKGRSEWREYYSASDHYSEEASQRKETVVARWIHELAPSTVWDLGANTGRFSRLASSRGIETIAFDADPFCIDEVYMASRRESDTHLNAVVSDLTNPSPGVGWAKEERQSLEQRGPVDLVLALALIHHLAIADNIPLPMIVDQLGRFGRAAILEFIPKEDPKVQQLLRDREDIFEAYTQQMLEAAVSKRFRIASQEVLGDSGRTLDL
jgi:hypothetical protein